MAKSAGKLGRIAPKKAVSKNAKSPAAAQARAVPAQKKQRRGAKLGTFVRSSLVAKISAGSMPADIEVTFTNGIGQITASLFRNGTLINLQTISSSGNIHYSDVQAGDTIAANGVCTGAAEIAVSIPTRPATPEHFPAGNINTGYDVV